jgi:hypothetical protein
MDEKRLELARRQLKDHQLRLLLQTPDFQAFRLERSADSRCMSTMFIFTLEGIVITGDLHPGERGVISAFGYDLRWFSGHNSPSYLAEKFLDQQWQVEHARAWLRDQIGGTESDDPSRGCLQAVLDDESWETEDDFYQTCQYQNCDLDPMSIAEAGMGYPEEDWALLVALQERFALLVSAAMGVGGGSMNDPERIDSGQIEGGGKTELMERLAAQAQTIETQRQTVARLERQVALNEQGMVRLTHDVGSYAGQVRMVRDERDAAVARAEATEVQAANLKRELAAEAYHARDNADAASVADEEANEAIGRADAAEMQAAAMRAELERQLRLCPNCHGQGRYPISAAWSPESDLVLRTQECLTCKPIRQAISGDAGTAFLAELTALRELEAAAREDRGLHRLSRDWRISEVLASLDGRK